MFIIAIGSLTKTDRKIKIKKVSHHGEHDVGEAQRKETQSIVIQGGVAWRSQVLSMAIVGAVRTW